MEINKKYVLAFDKIEKIVDKKRESDKYPAMGYTSNLDLISDFNVQKFNQLINDELPELSIKDIEIADKIDSVEKLIKTITYFCANGIGGEVDIEDEKVLKKYFDWEYGIGGTAVQAAMALATIKCPSIVHLTEKSKEMCELLADPEVYTVLDNGKLEHTDQIKSNTENEIHFIIQFKKGDIIQLKDQEIKIPDSNRLIITQTSINENLPLSDSYFKYIENNAEKISSNVLSSFNVIQDKSILLDRLKYIKKHLNKFREKNNSGIVFFEDAHYHNLEIKKLCMENIYPQVDILSLNEEELDYTLKFYDFPVEIENIISCVKGAEYLRDKFGIKKGVIVHTKDYSMYVGQKLEIDIEEGLIYGNLLATAKAKHGFYGNIQQISELFDLELSPRGVKARKEIENSIYSDQVVIVPTKYIDKPKYTVGLGDTFVAGVQLCF
ncbi:ADP-dependent glucokinase/phosphofructokinase [Halanaerobium sp. ST460_2HS_T2]|uniref:ADP-dependent glucokinase/phosphofructokinase n=1 Tax=Halanaerobium sp. ST460_2HS_T2 TaxID=2183914 RepID=UPI000DF3669E|nr:ADP-dependent glucokinase/phosphofructokinase [Halanaerobium sp. ST460_2HS_T2]RCW52208.1 ADP-dependent phosphofructokinase/glucokinase [Halanaerobium sp. ST460_2HS_T2]